MPTPLLELRNIGKIYVSEGNVAVGIRGVNLSFDRGEFVRHYKVVRKIEWLPYHTMGIFKYKELGLDYPLTDVPPLARERIEAIKKRFEGIFPC